MRLFTGQVPTNYRPHTSRTRRALVVAGLMVAVAVLAIATPASADPVPIGTFAYESNFADVRTPISGMAGFDGIAFFTPGAGTPIDLFELAVSPGIEVVYPGVVFSIDSGFVALSTLVVDSNASGGADFGDDVFTSLGGGSFSFTQGGDLLLGGTFDSATFTAKWGGRSGGVITSDPGGLDLFPGSAFIFEGGTHVDAILDPEGFSLGLASIPLPGVTTTAGVMLAPTIFAADMLPFGVANGSVNTSGELTVIPEPSTMAMTVLGVVGLALGAWRKRKSTV
ncbi:MAG: PEP-CTERM sorting domain-containing protein [Pirellulales bacterium]